MPTKYKVAVVLLAIVGFVNSVLAQFGGCLIPRALSLTKQLAGTGEEEQGQCRKCEHCSGCHREHKLTQIEISPASANQPRQQAQDQ